MTLDCALWLAIAAGVVAILYGVVSVRWILAQPAGNPRMQEIAAAMAESALANSDAHVALSTTGIAGPGGAVPGKPVGTVCFGWTLGHQTHTERLVFHGDRRSIREQTIIHSLQGLLRFLK